MSGGLALDALASVWRRLPRRARSFVLHRTQASFLCGVVGLVTDGEGRVLLLEHRFRVPHAWGLPGGFLKRGERPELGLVRELREETGIGIEVDPEIVQTIYERGPGMVTLVLEARHTEGELRYGVELLGGRWCAPEDLPAGTFPPHVDAVQRWAARRIALRGRAT